MDIHHVFSEHFSAGHNSDVLQLLHDECDIFFGCCHIFSILAYIYLHFPIFPDVFLRYLMVRIYPCRAAPFGGARSGKASR